MTATSRWDTVVRWNDAAGLWWWNAWCELTATELTGLSSSPETARAEMSRQIADVERSGAGSADST